MLLLELKNYLLKLVEFFDSQIVIVGTIMWQKIGVSILVGIGFLLITALIGQGSFSLLSRKIRAMIAPLTDRRVQLMSELVAGIQVSSGYLISYFTFKQPRWVKISSFKCYKILENNFVKQT